MVPSKCKKGFKKVSGKCVKLKGNGKGLKKKSYNPFKMWGSYVGAVVMHLTQAIFGLDYFNFWYLKVWQQVFNLPAWDYSVILQLILIGFFVGWGIHSLVRRSKK